MASATAMSRVLDIVEKEAGKGTVILVSSAISGCTDALQQGKAEGIEEMRKRHLAIVRRLFTGKECGKVSAETEALFREMQEAPEDERVTYGEIFSTRILYRKLCEEGYEAKWLDSRELVVKNNESDTYDNINAAVNGAGLYVAPGFICRDAQGKISTLGRGGSDYSAALYAAAVKAESLQIWTDVPGIMTANPKQVPQARTIPRMSYLAAKTMAENGAKVLYAPTVAPAMAAGIDIEIRNTFAPEGKYTVIGDFKDDADWVGIASDGGRVTVVSGDTLASLGMTERSSLGMTERSSLDMTSLSFRGPSGPRESLGGTAEGEAGMTLAAEALKEAGIKAVGMAENEAGLEIQVREGVLDQSLRALHRAFFEELPVKEIPLFIAGDGAVAKALAAMVKDTRESVAARTGKRLRIVGRANSRQFAIDLDGNPELGQKGTEIRTDESLELGLKGGALNENPGQMDYIAEVISQAPKGSIFVDCTDSETLYKRYEELLMAGIGIVSSNRRSFAVPYPEFAAMHAAALENGAPLRYETTVGAAMPVLDSIAKGANSSDEILSIEAVVSCTLNQILGDYIPGRESFASLLKKAQEAGLTEADPRMDLGGRDALRKLLILAREAGVKLEEADVKVEPIIPQEAFQGTLTQFFNALETSEDMIASKADEAASRGQRLRFVASLKKGIDGNYLARIGLKSVSPGHPSYYLRGTENAIIIRSAFHPYPLVIQGPGEGAREAASSILNDILR